MLIAVIVTPYEFPDFSHALNLTPHLATTTKAIYVRQADGQWLWDGYDYYPNVAETRAHLPIFTFSQFITFPPNVTLDYLQSTYPEAFL